MTYKAKLKVQFDTEWTSTHYSGGFDDCCLPEEHYTFEVPAEDLNIHQLFHFFQTVARAMGHDNDIIAKGACNLAFNEMRTPEDMRKTAEEYDLVMAEDVAERIQEGVKKELEIERELTRLQQNSTLFSDPADHDDGTDDYWEKSYWKIRNAAMSKIRALEEQVSAYQLAQTPVD